MPGKTTKTKTAPRPTNTRIEPTPFQQLMDLCRVEPNPFIEYVMGFRQSALHIDMQDHLTAFRNAGISTHRGSGKTDQISVARAAFEIGRNPEVRIKVWKNAQREAVKVTQACRNLLMTKRYQDVFPGIRPDPWSQWQNRSFKVEHKSRHEKEPTYAAYGITEAATGGRYDIGILDDVCDAKNSIQMPALREQVKDTWRDVIDNMGVPGCRNWYVYTPYHVDDLTAWLERMQSVNCLIRPVDDDFNSPCPELWTPQELIERRDRIGSIAYDRAYRLKRVSDADLILRAEWLDKSLYWDMPTSQNNWIVIGSFDLAFTKPRLGGMPKKNKPDWTAAVSALVNPATCNVWILRVRRWQTTFPEFKEQLQKEFPGVTRWVGEAVQGQIGLIDDMNHTLPIQVIPMTPGEGRSNNLAFDKRGRLAYTSPLWESGKVHLRGRMLPVGTIEWYDYGHQQAYDELTTFPASGDDDIVDATSQLLRYVRLNYEKNRTSTKAIQDREKRRTRRSSEISQVLSRVPL